ncbi:MAG: AsmA family protein [Nitrospirae bacterium]|nr:AsmA family protein [Candidatus Manganitrophaceae bacterium]
MKRSGRRIAGIFFVLLFVLSIVPFLIDLSFLKSRFLPQVEAALGRSVDVGSIRLSAWPFGIRLKRVVIRDDPQFSSEDFVKSDDIVLNLRFFPLLQKRIEVEQLLLHRPEIRLIQDQSGRWNTSTLGKGTEKEAQPSPGAPPKERRPLGVAADRLTIKEGKVIYLKRLKEGAPLTVSAEKIDLNVTDLQLGKTASIALKTRLEPKGESVHLEGRIGTLTPALRPELIELSGGIGQNDLRLRGGFQKGRLLLMVNSEQIDLDELMLLLPQTASSQASPARSSDRSSASVPVEVAFNLKKVRIKGIEASDLLGKATMDRKGTSIQGLEGRIWGGRFAGSARMETAATFPFNTTFSLQEVALGPLVKQFVPVNPDLFSGAASVKLALQGKGGSWEALAKTLTGEGEWEVGAGEIKNFNLVKESLSVLRTLDVVQLPLESKTSFSSAKGAFRVDAGRVELENLLMNSPLFQLVGKGEIAVDGAYQLLGNMVLAESMTKQIRKTPAGSLLPAQGGRLAVPIEITGTPQRVHLAVREEALKEATAKKLRKQLSDKLEKEGLGGLLKR